MTASESPPYGLLATPVYTPSLYCAAFAAGFFALLDDVWDLGFPLFAVLFVDVEEDVGWCVGEDFFAEDCVLLWLYALAAAPGVDCDAGVVGFKPGTLLVLACAEGIV